HTRAPHFPPYCQTHKCGHTHTAYTLSDTHMRTHKHCRLSVRHTHADTHKSHSKGNQTIAGLFHLLSCTQTQMLACIFFHSHTHTHRHQHTHRDTHTHT